MDIESLRDDLRQLIADECDIDLEPGDISNTEALLGEGARLGLDSLDALSIALEVKHRFGVHIDSGNETRLALSSVDALAEFILAS